MFLAPLSVDQFRNRFFLENAPYWFAYEAKANGGLIGRFQNDELTNGAEKEDILEYAWMKFEEFVGDYAFAKIKIECRTSPNAKRDSSIKHTVQWGEVPTSNRSYSPAVSNQGVGANMGWQQMQFFLTQLESMRTKFHDSQMEVMRLNFENQSLAEALEADLEPSWKERAIIEGIGAVKQLITPAVAPQPAMLGTMGQRTETQSSVSTEENQRSFSMDRAIADIQLITNMFPEHHRNDVLSAFVVLAQQHHGMIKGILDQAVNDLHAQQG